MRTWSSFSVCSSIITPVLLVIFGAGASYDSVPHFPVPTTVIQKGSPQNELRPPLANELFEDRPLFVRAMERFSDCMALVPRLRLPGVVVEQELAKLQQQATAFPYRAQQLAAIRYYLHFALWECQKGWSDLHRGITNHRSLLDEIERWRYEQSEQVCIVTFNYDTILEDAMQAYLRFGIENLGSYISRSTYSVIKLHGSINWGREVEGISVPRNWGPQRLIQEAGKLRISDQYRIVATHPMVMQDDHLIFPALSIPVEKKDEFSCPTEHINALNETLPKVNRVITIGWRATELDFLKLLHDKVGHCILMIVSGDESGVRETQLNLTKSGALKPRKSRLVPYGFTGLINRMEFLETFLREPL